MITIRNFTDSDYAVLCELDAPMFSGMGGPILFRHIQELFGELFFVAEYDGKIIGYILGGVHLEDVALGKLVRIGVCKGFQRKECGTKLTDALFSRMKERGIKRVHLTVAETNAPAISFYKKIGFVQKDYRENYFYPDIPRLILEKEL
ncbi:GNAT family N-acetyltransferase [Methanocorpusculaceae archaeon]|nr:GNAT family N-acetyltransferase [Methanocorpusculaceae archaeon]